MVHRAEQQVFVYEPPQVMLLHDNPLNADTIGKVLSLFARRGYTFIASEEALKDPAISCVLTRTRRSQNYRLFPFV